MKTSTATDEELMAAYVSGNEAAFRLLFERYAPILLRLTRRHLRDDELAHHEVLWGEMTDVGVTRMDVFADGAGGVTLQWEVDCQGCPTSSSPVSAAAPMPLACSIRSSVMNRSLCTESRAVVWVSTMKAVHR